MDPMPDDLTPEELMADAEAADALPERAVMSTLNVTSLDAASGAVEAAGDGVPDVSATDAGAADAAPAAEHALPPQAAEQAHAHAAPHAPHAPHAHSSATAEQPTSAPADQGATEPASQATAPAPQKG